MSEQATNTKDLSTKDRLLQAAMEVFAAKGFQTATVREICQAAGTNVAAVNYHFGDKERLYAAVLWHVFEDYGTSKDRETVRDKALPPEKRLARLIETEIHYFYKTKDQMNFTGHHFPLFLMEMAHPSPSLDKVVEHFIRPDYEVTMEILRDIMGQDTPREVLDRCCDSLWGQMMHQVFTGPIDDLLAPERALASRSAKDMADHITTITLGGLAALKAKLDKQRKQS